MKNKIFTFLVSLFCIAHYTYALPLVGKIPHELKVMVIKLGQITIGVIVSIFVIWIGLNIYKKYLENKLAKPETNEKSEVKEQKITVQKKNKNKHQNNNFRCEIDDTQSLDEAINIFLTIDNRH